MEDGEKAKLFTKWSMTSESLKQLKNYLRLSLKSPLRRKEVTKIEFIEGIEKAQRYLQKKYEESNLRYVGCCRAIGVGFYERDFYSGFKIKLKMEAMTDNKHRDGFYLGDFTDENLFKRMMVLECLMEEMIKDGSYKEL